MEDIDEYNLLYLDPKYSHIILTNCRNFENIICVNGILKLGQVQAGKWYNANNKWEFKVSCCPCSCSHCKIDPLNSSTCVYRNEREIKRECVSQKDDANDDDYLGLNKMKVDELKHELHERGLRVGGRKQELIDQLRIAIIT